MKPNQRIKIDRYLHSTEQERRSCAALYSWRWSKGESMKLIQAVFSSILVFIANSNSAKAAPDTEVADFISYFRSVRTPTILEVCAPIVANKEGFTATADNWLNANVDAIERGKKVAMSKVKNEKELDESNESMLASLKNEFGRKSSSKKSEFCTDAYKSYKLPTQTSANRHRNS
jgi:hypothetical protein